MQNHRLPLLGLMLASLLFTACGDGDTKPATDNKADAKMPAPQPGEVVVGVSGIGDDKQDYETKKQWIQATRELVENDKELAYPAGYTVRVDDEPGRPDRLRFWLVPDPGNETDPADDADAAKAEDKDIIDAEADAYFVKVKATIDARVIAELEAEKTALQTEMADVAKRTMAIRSEYNRFLQNQRGLDETKASRAERQRLDRDYTNGLDFKISLEKQIAALQKRLARKDHATLVQINR